MSVNTEGSSEESLGELPTSFVKPHKTEQSWNDQQSATNSNLLLMAMVERMQTFEKVLFGIDSKINSIVKHDEIVIDDSISSVSGSWGRWGPNADAWKSKTKNKKRTKTKANVCAFGGSPLETITSFRADSECSEQSGALPPLPPLPLENDVSSPISPLEVLTQHSRPDSDDSTRPAFEASAITAHQELLLPEHPCITSIEVIYQLLICGEFMLISCIMCTGVWDDDPSVGELSFLILATVFSIVFIASRFKTAQLNGFQLYDNDTTYVRERYLRGWFPFDLGTIVPFDFILLATVSLRGYRLAQVLRLLKILRSPSMFRSSNPLDSPRRYEILSAALFIVISHHIIAVIYMLFRSADGSTSDYYIEAIYWAVQTTSSVGFGDLSTYNDTPSFRIYTTIVMLVGSGSYAWFVGNVSVYFMAKDVLGKKQRKTRNIVLQLLNRYEIPQEIKKEAYALYPLIFGDTCMQHTEILRAFPPSLQSRITLAMRLNMISQVPMFRGAEKPILLELAAKLIRHVVEANVPIIETDEAGREMFFLSVGTVEIFVRKNGIDHRVALLHDGSWFGEIAILRDTRRTAAAKTVTASELFVLTKQDFLSIQRRHENSQFYRAIQEEIENRMKELDNQLYCQSLESSCGESTESPKGNCTHVIIGECNIQIDEAVVSSDNSPHKLNAFNLTRKIGSWKRHGRARAARSKLQRQNNNSIHKDNPVLEDVLEDIQ